MLTRINVLIQYMELDLILVGKHVIMFGVYMSSSVHIYNKKKYIFILGVGPTQGLDDSTLTGET